MGSWPALQAPPSWHGDSDGPSAEICWKVETCGNSKGQAAASWNSFHFKVSQRLQTSLKSFVSPWRSYQGHYVSSGVQECHVSVLLRRYQLCASRNGGQLPGRDDELVDLKVPSSDTATTSHWFLWTAQRTGKGCAWSWPFRTSPTEGSSQLVSASESLTLP